MTETMRTVEIPWERVDRTQPVIVAVKDDRTATVEYKRATFNSTVDAGENVMDPVRALIAGFAENAGRPALAVVIYDVREDPEHYLMVCTDEGDLVPDDYADDDYDATALAGFRKWLAANGVKTKRKRAGSTPATSVEHLMDDPEPEPEPEVSAASAPAPEPTVEPAPVTVERPTDHEVPEEPEDDALTAIAEATFVKPERAQDTSVTGPTIHKHVASDSPFKSSGLMEEGKHSPRAKYGWQGAVNNLLNTNLAPGPAEAARRESVADIVAGWPGVKRVAVVNDKGGAGKALSVDEPVVTPTGYRRIGDLVAGDLVTGVDGKPYPVLGVFPQGVRELFDVTFSDGTTIRADGEHLWEVQTVNDRFRDTACAFPDCARPVVAGGLCSPHYQQNYRGQELHPVRAGRVSVERATNGSRVMTTAQLLEAGLGTIREGRGMRHSYFAPVTGPVEGVAAETPVDPYLLGALLGDGYLPDDGVAISSADQQMLDMLADLVPAGVSLRRKAGYDWRFVSGSGQRNPLLDAVRAVGLAGARSATKFVPDAYRFNTAEVRLAVLQGLLDTDGYSEPGRAATFTSVSRRLAEDVAWLAESLGCVASMSGARATGYTDAEGAFVSGLPAWNVRITAPESVDLFRLDRKQAVQVKGQRVPQRAVVSITAAGSGEAVCIAVDSPRHLFLARNHVPTHNTPVSILLAAAIARASTLPVAVFDNNESAGMAKDRVEVVGQHDATAKDLATQSAGQEKMSATEVMQYMHYHPEDRYHLLAAHHPRIVDNEVDPPLSRDEVGAVYRALAEPYRLVVTDSGNSWTRENWGAMVARADQLVVPMVTSKDRFRRAEDTLNNLYNLGGVFQDLTRNAVVVVSTWQPGDRAVAADFADRWAGRVREVVVIPYDEHVGSHNLRFDALKPATQDAFLRLGAAVVRGLRGE